MEEQKEVLVVQIDKLIAEMASVVVDSDEKYQYLEQWLRRNKETQKVVTTAYEQERTEAKAKYDAVLEARGKMLKPLELAESVARGKMVSWSTEREKKRREEEQRLMLEARKAKEAEVLEQADTLVAMGRVFESEKLISKEVVVTKASVAAKATETKVGKTMEKWVVSIVDMEAFIAYLPGMTLVQDCLDVNTSKLAALFKKNGTKSFPGLKIEQTFVPVL